MRRVNALSAMMLLGTVVGSAGAQSYSKTNVITYHDDLSKWVLGQIRTSVNQDTGRTESQVDYDPATAKPQRIHAFGQLQQTIHYNSDGTVRAVVDGRGNTVSLSGWKRGIPGNIQYADGSTQSAGVDDNGWIRWITDGRGNTTRYDYDAMGRMSLVDYPDGDTVDWASTTTQFAQVGGAEYGIPAGHWRRTVSTGNARKVTYYDALWRPLLVREYDAGNEAGTQRASVTAYDTEGRVTFQSYPVAGVGTVQDAGTGVRTTYDALGRVVQVSQDSEIGALVSTTEYLPGRRVRTTNARGIPTVVTYTGADAAKLDWPVRIELAEGAVLDIPRDVFGKPTSITRRASNGSVTSTRRYVYDAAQRLCKTIEPETGATVFDYDAASNPVGSAQGLDLSDAGNCNQDIAAASGRRVVRSYDARNRLASLQFPDGNGNQRWSYWPDGLVKQVTTLNAGVETHNSYAYNRRGLLIGEVQSPTDGEALAMGYAYDALGNLSAHRYPSGNVVAYAPNALGQAGQAGSYAAGVVYYPNGAIRQFTYGNGIVHTMVQNARQLPDESQDTLGATRILSDGYDYDAVGNVMAITDGATGRNQRGNRNLGYDALDRLVSASSPMFGSASYSYDALDNLTRVTILGRDHHYCYDNAWRLTNVKVNGCGGATVVGLTYDAQGNLRAKNGQPFTFDFGNRLRAAAGSESYRYDADGRRTQTDSSFGRITSMYDHAGVLRYQASEREDKRTDYITLGGSLVAKAAVPMRRSPAAKDFVGWSPVASAVRYVVEESVDGVTWTTVYEGNAANWTSAARPATSYAYRVLACGATGSCTPVSDVSHVQRPQGDIVPLLYQLLLG